MIVTAAATHHDCVKAIVVCHHTAGVAVDDPERPQGLVPRVASSVEWTMVASGLEPNTKVPGLQTHGRKEGSRSMASLGLQPAQCAITNTTTRWWCDSQ